MDKLRNIDFGVYDLDNINFVNYSCDNKCSSFIGKRNNLHYIFPSLYFRYG